jgi:hypothetical protein
VILIIFVTQLASLGSVVDILRKLKTNRRGYVSTIVNLTGEIRRLENLLIASEVICPETVSPGFWDSNEMLI